MDPTEERFRALARSAPWRWHALRFTTGRRHAGEDRAVHTVRAAVRRPGRLRVESLDGAVLQRQADPDVAEPPAVELDDHGLLSRAPDQVPAVRFDFEPPMYQDYHWVAMLDPYELADGWDDEGTPAPGTEILDLTAVEHHGRPAWQARLRTTRYYDPRCGCCPLLYSAESEAAENHEPAPGTVFADAYLVRLDVATGVCVFSEDVGGTRSGQGHDVVIEGVDEDMPDELFGKPRSHAHRFRAYRTADGPDLRSLTAYRDEATPGRRDG
ncbi:MULTISPECIES: hypothetical protein [Prauserella salsuginis group]|uniref:Uncharacterized protein n=2 Tax=Prauserella salsuginis group TaxID=2893672 RepID=A0A839XLA5_9PSEU|nr:MULTISPECIES: hypothetical protein [Prauserella salsuginis group]MBB3663387.1 hypothetical protein [Prauserella sediminis]MCR3720788.1 hypothetical protein [Prauserella flava]MCR3735131.1 hypothetical protein [Prauserella salsuginis]